MIGIALALMLQATVAFATVARGTDSQLTEPRQVVIRSADEWRALWAEHSAEPAPAVDFSRSIVIGVFLGTRPTAGYIVDVVSVRAQGGATVVEYRERRPPGGLRAQVLTAPFHMVSVSRDVMKIEFRKTEPAN